jgi:hypothetical protein
MAGSASHFAQNATCSNKTIYELHDIKASSECSGSTVRTDVHVAALCNHNNNGAVKGYGGTLKRDSG